MSDAVITLGIGETQTFTLGDSIEGGAPDGLGITAVDHEAGTITLGNVLKRLYSEDVVQDIVFGVVRNADPVRLAGCRLRAIPGRLEFTAPTESLGAIGGATIAVVTAVAALEWLRQRKVAVAAAEGSDEAYRSLLSDFIVWLTALFARMRSAQT